MTKTCPQLHKSYRGFLSPSSHIRQTKERKRENTEREREKPSASRQGPTPPSPLAQPQPPEASRPPSRPPPSSPGSLGSPPREGLPPYAPCAVGRVASTPLPTGGPPSSPRKRWPGRGMALHSFCIWPPRVRIRGPAWPGTPHPGTDGQSSGGPLGRGHTSVCRWALGGDVAPRTALTAEGVWSGLLKGLDLVTDAR